MHTHTSRLLRRTLHQQHTAPPITIAQLLALLARGTLNTQLPHRPVSAFIKPQPAWRRGGHRRGKGSGRLNRLVTGFGTHTTSGLQNIATAFFIPFTGPIAIIATSTCLELEQSRMHPGLRRGKPVERGRDIMENAQRTATPSHSLSHVAADTSSCRALTLDIFLSASSAYCFQHAHGQTHYVSHPPSLLGFSDRYPA
jgi:hypothetical protein